MVGEDINKGWQEGEEVRWGEERYDMAMIGKRIKTKNMKLKMKREEIQSWVKIVSINA